MAANDNVIACGADFSFEELLAAAIGKDASGKPTLRLHDSNSVSGSKFFDCATGISKQGIEAGLKGLFTLDSQGDVAIRVSLI
jgi:hypothetical protein